MASASESVIVQDPEIPGGEPVFRGTRVPFQNLLDYLEGGETLDEFLEQFPGVSRESKPSPRWKKQRLLFLRASGNENSHR
jgi:uncharacterized protein (DUF433 family)